MRRICCILLGGVVLAAVFSGCGGGSSGGVTPATSPTGSSAISTFSAAGYTPGGGALVTLAVTPPTGASAYAVQDGPPNGWTVSNISASGSYDAVNNLVKWGPFFDATKRTLQYTVTPPLGSSGTQQFAGVASFDGSSIAITGSRTFAKE